MLSWIRNILILVVLVMLAGLRPAFAECVEVPPPGQPDCHIGSAKLEINLGPLPVDRCLDHSNNRTPPILPTNSCPVTKSIRNCIIDYLKGYKSQGVTGVRFQFGLGGGGSSTAFNSDGTVNRKWANNLQTFFWDLARNTTVKNITFTPALGFWGGDDAFATQPTTVTSCGQTETLIFVKWLPYGLRNGDFLPACQNSSIIGNSGYNNADSNSNFWGWQPFFNLMDLVLAKAAAQGLTVTELDIENELDLQNFTVYGRLIYDNIYRPNQTDVFGEMRILMDKYFPNTSTARVTYSTMMSGTHNIGGEHPWDADGFDCISVYGDSALVTSQSELATAYAHGLIGQPSGTGDHGTFDESHGLPCGGDPDTLFEFPHSYSQPTINDIHAYICIPKPYDPNDPRNDQNHLRCYDPQIDSGVITNENYGSLTARTFFNKLWAFLDRINMETNKVVIGETEFAQTPSSNDCWKELKRDGSMAYSLVNGFYGYNGTTSDLYQNAASNTVLRPWENDQNGCYQMPNTIKPPYCLGTGTCTQ